MPVAKKKKKAKAKRKLARKTNAQIKKQIREGKQLRRKMVNTLDKALKKSGSSLVVKTRTKTFRPKNIKKLGEVLNQLHEKNPNSLKGVKITVAGSARDVAIGYLMSGRFQEYLNSAIVDRTQDFVDTSRIEAQMGSIMIDKVDQIMARAEAITQTAIDSGKTGLIGVDDAIAIAFVGVTMYGWWKAINRPQAVEEKAKKDKEKEEKAKKKGEKKKGSGIFLPPILEDYLRFNGKTQISKEILQLNNSLMKTVKPSMFQPRF